MLKSTHEYWLWCPQCDQFGANAFKLPEDVVNVKSKSRVTHCSKCKTKLKRREIFRNVPTPEGKDVH